MNQPVIESVKDELTALTVLPRDMHPYDVDRLAARLVTLAFTEHNCDDGNGL